MEVTAADIVRLLYKKFEDGRQYACATEVANATGGGARRLDFVAVNCYESKCFAVEGVEIKVSRPDLMREFHDAGKHAFFYDKLDYFSLACPEDIVDMKLIPPKWGVYVVRPDGSLRAKRRPLALHDAFPCSIDKAFAVNLMRRIAYASPAEEEKRRIADEAYKKGCKEGEAAVEYRYSRLAKTEAELAEYRKLFEELKLWGAGDIQRGIEGFKEYQKVDRSMLAQMLESARNAIGYALEALPGGSEET